MKNIFLITLLLFMLSISGLFAQPAWVRRQATPQENTLNDITRIPGTDKLVAVGEGSTVMISEDAGDSWQIILHPAGFNNGYKCKTVKFIDENTGFIGGSYRTMLKTTNGGYYWTKVIDATTVYEDEAFQSIAFPVHDTGFAVNDLGEVFRTVNTGNSWNKIQLNTYFTPIRVLFLNSTEGFIIGGSTSQFLKTRDGGLSWDSIGKPDGLPDNKYIYSVKYINDSIGFMNLQTDSNEEIYRTGDGGLTWVKVFSNYPLMESRFSFSDAENGIAVYVDFNYTNKIIITHDSGVTWERNTTDDLPWHCSNAVETAGAATYITVGKNIFNMNKSTDGGLNWDPVGKCDIFGNVIQAEIFDSVNLCVMTKGLSGGISNYNMFKSFDRGASWSFIYSESAYGGGFDFISPDTGFMISCSDYPHGIMRTKDGGLNWESFPIDQFDTYLDMTFFDYHKGMIAGANYLLRTQDAGETWEKVLQNSEGFYQVEYLSQNKIIAAGRDNSTKIYISEDEGDTWLEKTIGDYHEPTALFVMNDSVYFVATYFHIFKTTDGGNTWIDCIYEAPNSIINSIYFPSADTGYAVGGGAYINALRTVDGGLNWTVSETNTSSVLNKVYFNDNNHGLAFGNLGVVLETTTGGVADARKPDKAVQQIYFTPQPNPFTDQLTLQFETANNAGKTTLAITDLSGKTIKIISIGGKIDQLLINLPQLPKGIYLLNLYKGNQLLQSEKVVKQ